jgi:hypothetical protein
MPDDDSIASGVVMISEGKRDQYLNKVGSEISCRDPGHASLNIMPRHARIQLSSRIHLSSDLSSNAFINSFDLSRESLDRGHHL